MSNGEDHLPAILDDNLVAIAEAAEKRIDAVKKIKSVALRVTNERDWTNQGGNPYLQVSGAEKVGRLFGISWRIEEPIRENLEEGHFSYTYKGEFSLHGSTIEAVGTRNSKDEFFRVRYQGYGENRKKVFLPASEVDQGDVKKGAYTNCVGNGVTRLLGIRNLTWWDLKTAGLNVDSIGKVDYKKKPPGDRQEQPDAQTHGGDSPASESQIKAIFATSKKREYSDEDRAHLCEMVSNKRTKSTKELTKAEASAAIEFLNKQDDSPGASPDPQQGG